MCFMSVKTDLCWSANVSAFSLPVVTSLLLSYISAVCLFSWFWCGSRDSSLIPIHWRECRCTCDMRLWFQLNLSLKLCLYVAFSACLPDFPSTVSSSFPSPKQSPYFPDNLLASLLLFQNHNNVKPNSWPSCDVVEPCQPTSALSILPWHPAFYHY